MLTGSENLRERGFLANVNDGGLLIAKAGISKPVINTLSADQVLIDGSVEQLSRPLDMEARYTVSDDDVILEAIVKDAPIPFFTLSADEQIFVLNTHTFSEADFEAVGEVLLCPRQLGLLDIPQSWANILRRAFNEKLNLELDAPTRVTMQPLENGDIVLHNYNKNPVELKLSGTALNEFRDAFSEQEIQSDGITLNMKPRSRIWLKKTDE